MGERQDGPCEWSPLFLGEPSFAVQPPRAKYTGCQPYEPHTKDVFGQWTHVSLPVRTSVALGLILVTLGGKKAILSTKKKSS
jgi:hypothetical protein